jgi:hypothetical protein
MDAERFQKDQDYFNHKRALLNRFALGAGVLRGLRLTFEPATGNLRLAPGIAIDFAGREIIVPAGTRIDPTQLTDAKGRQTGPAPTGATVLISLAYAERQTDAVAVLVPDCDHPNGCAPATIAEGFSVLVRLAPSAVPVAKGCTFGTLPTTAEALRAALADRIAENFSPAPADPSIPLGRLTLPGGPLDAVSDRPLIYNNNLLLELSACLAAQLDSGTLAYVSGDNQTAPAGAALQNPLVVSVLDSAGNPVTGGPAPTFTITAGGGTLGAVATPNPGTYQAIWTLGTTGAQIAQAQLPGSPQTIKFTATVAT